MPPSKIEGDKLFKSINLVSHISLYFYSKVPIMSLVLILFVIHE